MKKTDRTRTGGGLWLALGVSVVVTAIIFALIAYPALSGGDGRTEVAATLEPEDDTPLADLVEDARTQTYLNTLDATFPASANELQAALINARRRGADDAEINLMILQAATGEIMANLDRLSRADVGYLNEILSLTSERLETLNGSGEPYCQGSDLVRFAGLAEQDLYRTVFEYLETGDPLYEYLLDVNAILLDAIRDARSDPQVYARPGQSDMNALQTLGLSIITDPDITLLLTTEGKSRTEMDEALDSVNFCTLGTRMIGRVQNLPEQTKGRIWYEGLRQLRINGIRRIIWMLSTY